MKYVRMPIEIESPEQMGYEKLKNNLTESSFRDEILEDQTIHLNGLTLCYSDHAGLLPLREEIAADFGVKPQEVLTTPGAATALFIVATSLLEKDSRLLVVRPNYATNLETPKAIGAKIEFYDLHPESNFQIRVEEFLPKITPSTKLVSITLPHNPTGVLQPEADLIKIIQKCEKENVLLLVDETYRDMSYRERIANNVLNHQNVIRVSSLSKTYGLPGIRTGWITCTNPELYELFLAAKEQILITGSVVDETLAHKYFKNRHSMREKNLAVILKHFDHVEKWITQETRMGWVLPAGGSVCFPWIKNATTEQVEKFYSILNNNYGTFVGPGHWFEQPKNFMRIGFGWPKEQELKDGLHAITQALNEARIK